MRAEKFKTAYVLSILIVILMIFASVGGLLISGLYRDNDFIARLWRGNDLVTLMVAVPMLIGAMIFAKKGSLRGFLVWFGVLAFTLYNYAFYLFAAAFNWFFWIYVALFSLSIFALIFGLTEIDSQEIGKQFGPGTPVKWIAGYVVAFSFFMGSMWVIRSLRFFTTGQVPQDIIQTGHPTGIVYALDLSLVVPFMLLGAVWLWQRRAWGYIIVSMMMVKGFTYPLALVVMSIISTIAGTGYDPLTPFYAVLCLGCLVSLGFLLGNMKTNKEARYEYVS